MESKIKSAETIINESHFLAHTIQIFSRKQVIELIKAATKGNMTDTSLFIFVFTKDKIIKVLNSLDTAHNQSKLILEGWTHTATLADPCAFIQYLHNECEDIDRVYEIECLSNPKI